MARSLFRILLRSFLASKYYRLTQTETGRKSFLLASGLFSMLRQVSIERVGRQIVNVGRENAVTKVVEDKRLYCMTKPEQNLFVRLSPDTNALTKCEAGLPCGCNRA